MRTRTRSANAALAAILLMAAIPATSDAARTKYECGDKGQTVLNADGTTTRYVTFAKGIRTRSYRCRSARGLALKISRSWYLHTRIPRGWALVANPIVAPNGSQFLIFERDRVHGATQRISFTLSTETPPQAGPTRTR